MAYYPAVVEHHWSGVHGHAWPDLRGVAGHLVVMSEPRAQQQDEGVEQQRRWYVGPDDDEHAVSTVLVIGLSPADACIAERCGEHLVGHCCVAPSLTWSGHDHLNPPRVRW